MNYQESCNVFRRVSDFYLKHERFKAGKVIAPLFRQVCGRDGFGRLTIKVGGDGVLQLIIHHKKGYVYTTDRDFYPNKFPIVFREVLSPEELATILNNPKNYKYGLFYSNFMPFLLKLENLLGDTISGKGIPYSFNQNFKNGNPEYSFFSVNDDPWGHPLSHSTLKTIEKLKKQYFSSLTSDNNEVYSMQQ